jgi:hypothetical protein
MNGLRLITLDAWGLRARGSSVGPNAAAETPG